ncbi:hypothetical protein L195_g026170 [Trifolium pratense]|uniref:Uncharacterized protein n=1 Tax=Trifolium pratense TaxID=57577 RepID=A0A2K3NIK3_TRIPR|nr:hypothetical protein L195_g026170 [Trifolium pratense]
MANGNVIPGKALKRKMDVVVVMVLSWDGGGCVTSEKGVVWRRLRRF